MYSCFGSRRRAASSSSSGRFVAPTSRTRRMFDEGSQPSICTSISVLRRRDDSCSPSVLRALSNESISSMNITAGCKHVATAKRVRTIFSPWPIHLEVKDEAEILKKVAFMLLAIALPISVFPVPGGPKSNNPLGGARAPLNMCGFIMGHTTISCTSCFAWNCPAMSSQCRSPSECMTSLQTSSTSCWSRRPMDSGSSPSGPARSWKLRGERACSGSAPSEPGRAFLPSQSPAGPWRACPQAASTPFRMNGGTYPPPTPRRPPRESPTLGGPSPPWLRGGRCRPFLSRSAARTSRALANAVPGDPGSASLPSGWPSGAAAWRSPQSRWASEGDHLCFPSWSRFLLLLIGAAGSDAWAVCLALSMAARDLSLFPPTISLFVGYVWHERA
mmetsp:Transcript_39086/g.92566  ORF Transcript_39086/g.92566 Transcript_39086/m.92566 type:complete len:388 (-) Transcript_39086:782-1945(-)